MSIKLNGIDLIVKFKDQLDVLNKELDMPIIGISMFGTNNNEVHLSNYLFLDIFKQSNSSFINYKIRSDDVHPIYYESYFYYKGYKFFCLHTGGLKWQI